MNLSYGGRIVQIQFPPWISLQNRTPGCTSQQREPFSPGSAPGWV
jgi:hypothetical protein